MSQSSFDPSVAFRQGSLAGIIVALDAPAWTIIDANDAYLAVTRRAREELIGCGLLKAFPESAETSEGHGAQHVRLSLEQARDCKHAVRLPVQRYDLPSVTGQGFDEHHWMMSSRPLFDAAGDIVAVLHEVENATARVLATRERVALESVLNQRNATLEWQRAELEDRNQQLEHITVELEAQAEELQVAAQQLEENEQQLRQLVDAMPTLAWTARADGYIDWFNARWYEYTGCSASDMEGWGWQSVHHPDELGRVVAGWTHAIAMSEPFEMTFPLRAADGEYRYFLTRVAPLRDAEGNVVGTSATSSTAIGSGRM